MGDTFTAEVLAVYGNTSKVVTEDVEWSSSSDKVAEVSKDGEVKGIAVGKATITAKVDGKTLTMSVEVGMASGLEADVNFIALASKETQQITLTGTDEDGNTLDVTSEATWKTSNARVADVKKVW